jgi:hypothetical protein
MDPDDEADGADDGEVETEALPPDPFLTAIALCQIAERAKPISAALKRLRKVGRDIVAAEARLAAVTAQVEQKQAALTERESAIAAREVALEGRESELAVSAQEARDNLRGYYNSIAEADRHIRYRILSHADLLHGYNAQLQDLPSWEQLKRMVVGLPDDLPAPAPQAVTREVTLDWTGNVFVPGSTLTRSVPPS